MQSFFYVRGPPTRSPHRGRPRSTSCRQERTESAMSCLTKHLLNMAELKARSSLKCSKHQTHRLRPLLSFEMSWLLDPGQHSKPGGVTKEISSMKNPCWRNCASVCHHQFAAALQPPELRVDASAAQTSAFGWPILRMHDITLDIMEKYCETCFATTSKTLMQSWLGVWRHEVHVIDIASPRRSKSRGKTLNQCG